MKTTKEYKEMMVYYIEETKRPIFDAKAYLSCDTLKYKIYYCENMLNTLNYIFEYYINNNLSYFETCSTYEDAMKELIRFIQ